jgi:hypothetical protein
MSAIIETPNITALRAPRPLISSFYLWWLVVGLQSTYLAYTGLTFAEAARIGGPAWDVLFDFAIPDVVVLAVTTLQLTFVLLMRQGIRGSRVVLVVIAVIMGPVDYLLATQVWRFFASTYAVQSAPIILTAVIVTASAIAVVAMYLPVSNAFFRSRRAAIRRAREVER